MVQYLHFRILKFPLIQAKKNEHEGNAADEADVADPDADDATTSAGGDDDDDEEEEDYYCEYEK